MFSKTTSLLSPTAKKVLDHQKCYLHLAPPFLVEDYVPLAVRAHREGYLKHRVEAAKEELRSCKACPRNCGVDRLQNKMGACNTGRKAIVSSAFPHFGEESVLQGWNGSGTIFFGMCNLRCVFCQNWDISQKKNGWELSAKEIADLMLKLQNESKLVTDTRYYTFYYVTQYFLEHIMSTLLLLNMSSRK